MKRILISIASVILLLGNINLNAQSDADALRFSMLDFGSTARAMGTAGAFGALGGDFSVMSTNPAGLGIYRSSEFVFTPALASFNTKSDFIGNRLEDDKYNFHISNAGLVFSRRKNRGRAAAKDWKATNFAIGFNRIANYNNQIQYAGYNEHNSFLDNYLESLNANGGTNPSDVYNSDPFGSGLAYETFLINPYLDDTVQYYSEISNGRVEQRKSIETSGGMDELVISLGANYKDKFYIGGTIGVPFLHYTEEYTYSETDVNDVHPNFESFDYNSYVNTEGAGINFKFGMLFKVNEYLRLGGAIHTPTLFNLQDQFYTSMSSSLDTTGGNPFDSPDGIYEYRLVTPWRVIGSAALVFRQFGLFTAEYEWLDYREASFNFDSGLGSADKALENALNQSIETKYSGAHNLRAGAEFMIGTIRLRGGYAFTTSPFKEGLSAGDADFSMQRFTAGIGLKEKSYFVDLAYVHTWSKSYDIQYLVDAPAEELQGAEISNISGNFMLSVGFRF